MTQDGVLGHIDPFPAAERSAPSGSYDLVVIGGGIAGAGVLAEAAGRGYRVALFEAGDFASGTSSRSSKLVHGGLRYLRTGQPHLTWESVRERDRLLRTRPDSVQRLDTTMLAYSSDRHGPRLTGLGLAVYDVMGAKWAHRWEPAPLIAGRFSGIQRNGLRGGHRYREASTDDVALVLRVLDQAIRSGGQAFNYSRVESVARGPSGQVEAVVVHDVATGRVHEVSTRVVINASGPWADTVRATQGRGPLLRLLRGSHLLVPSTLVPMPSAVTLMHPRDGRPVFAYPWCGATLVGTTDVDHGDTVSTEVRASRAEVDYLLELVNGRLSDTTVVADQVISVIAGVRPVLRGDHADPSKASRDALVIDEDGLVTATGGKLTTYRLMALRALDRAGRYLPSPSHAPAPTSGESARTPTANAIGIDDHPRTAEQSLLAAAGQVKGSAVRLDDLMLRRTRIGLLHKGGGMAVLDAAGSELRRILGWDGDTLRRETERYRGIWTTYYSPAPGVGP